MPETKHPWLNDSSLRIVWNAFKLTGMSWRPCGQPNDVYLFACGNSESVNVILRAISAVAGRQLIDLKCINWRHTYCSVVNLAICQQSQDKILAVMLWSPQGRIWLLFLLTIGLIGVAQSLLLVFDKKWQSRPLSNRFSSTSMVLVERA